MSEPSSRSMEEARKLIASYLIDVGVQQDECTSHEDRLGEEIAFALDAAWADGFESAKATIEFIAMSEERTTPPNPGAAEG